MKALYQMDAQSALGFVNHQRTHIETEVLARKYPGITYDELIPVDPSASAYAPSVTFYSQDTVGEAKFINGKADDIPSVNVTQGKFEQTVYMAGISYSFSREEIGAANEVGRNLSSEGAMAAADVSERLVDNMALGGNSQIGVEGLFNMTGITSVASGDVFSALSPDQILAQINDLIAAVMSESNGVDLPDTLVLPIAAYADISSRRLPDTNITVLNFLRASNAYTSMTQLPLDIRSSHHLTDRAILYRRDPQVLKLHMPMPLQFIEPQSIGLSVTVHGMLRVAPVSIRRPGAIRYLTGVVA